MPSSESDFFNICVGVRLHDDGTGSGKVNKREGRTLDFKLAHLSALSTLIVNPFLFLVVKTKTNATGKLQLQEPDAKRINSTKYHVI